MPHARGTAAPQGSGSGHGDDAVYGDGIDLHLGIGIGLDLHLGIGIGLDLGTGYGRRQRALTKH